MEFLPLLQSPFDDLKPSLFELLSEQQLSSLLPPTLRYLLVAAAQRRPRYLLRVLNSFDELYALLSLVVERHSLQTRCATFTEAFYGLRRERAPRLDAPRAGAAAPAQVRDALALRGRADIWRNLAAVVLVPYLRRKLEGAYEVEAPRAAVLGARHTCLPEGATPRQRVLFCCRWFLRNVYPSVNAAYCFAMLAFNLAYLFDGSRFHSPLGWLAGTRLRRVTGEDLKAFEAAGAAAGAGAARGRGGARVAATVLSGLSVMLPVGIFALKFLEWWYASDFARHLSSGAAERPVDLPPPAVDGLGNENKGTGENSEKAEMDREADTDADADSWPDPSERDAPTAASSLLRILTVPAPKDSSRCPICRAEITTATACQTGVVFCYTCIHRWISGTHPRQEAFMAAAADRPARWENGQGRCAVTGRRVLGGADGLRRIIV